MAGHRASLSGGSSLQKCAPRTRTASQDIKGTSKSTKPVEPTGLGVYIEIARALAAGRLTVNGEAGIIARVLVKITDSSTTSPILLLRM